MNNETTIMQDYEHNLVKTVRKLPPQKAEQLLDFARFLEAQMLTQELVQTEEPSHVAADNEKWDAVLESEESQNLLEKLAREASAEYKAGNTVPMTFDDD